MQRDSFGSRFGALVVIAGSAVGLGNIWRFPYMAGTNGGAAFIILYLVFVALICFPCMIAELMIGRRSRSNAPTSLRALAPGRRVWDWTGKLFIIIPILVLSYYCVIGGVTMEFFTRSLGMNPPSGNWSPVVWTAVFLLATGLIVVLGVQKGIERFSKVMMPLLFIIVILIAIRALTLPVRPGAEYSAADGIAFLFRPDFSKIDGKTCLAALGQAFFSLSLGSGVLMTYGSYIRPHDNLAKTAGQIAFFDLLFAIIAGCAIIPAVFALKDNPLAILSDNTDSALVFNILPDVFPQMPLGSLVGAFFFFALILAALTSSISQFEVPVSYLVEEKGLSRTVACAAVFCIALVLGMACALRPKVMSAFDGLCANWLMPLGGLIALLFVGWVLTRGDLSDELSSGGTHKVGERFIAVLSFAIRYLAPVGVIAVFLSQLFS